MALSRTGFDQIQGYLIAATMQPGQFAELYLKDGGMPEFEAARRSLDMFTAGNA